MTSFQHIIITRFNLVYPGWKKDKHGNQLNSLEWLNHRFPLFERFCYPSVKGQSNQNFVWYVCFDETTPEHFRARIDNYRQRFPNFTPLFTTSERWVHDIRLQISDSVDYLISTRLDNDDAFHRDAIKVIQTNFRKQQFEFLNILKGYVWYGERLDFLQETSNMFISLVERRRPAEPFTTIRGCGFHTKVHELGPVCQIVTRGPHWLRIIHERNVRRGKPTRRISYLSRALHSIFPFNKFLIDKLYPGLCARLNYRYVIHPVGAPIPMRKKTRLLLDDIKADFSI